MDSRRPKDSDRTFVRFCRFLGRWWSILTSTVIPNLKPQALLQWSLTLVLAISLGKAEVGAFSPLTERFHQTDAPASLAYVIWLVDLVWLVALRLLALRFMVKAEAWFIDWLNGK